MPPGDGDDLLDEMGFDYDQYLEDFDLDQDMDDLLLDVDIPEEEDPYGAFDDDTELFYGEERILEDTGDTDAAELIGAARDELGTYGIDDGSISTGPSVAFDDTDPVETGDVDADEIAFRDTDVTGVGDVTAGTKAFVGKRMTGERNTVEEAGMIEADDTAVTGYDVHRAREIRSHTGTAVMDSSLGRIGSVHATGEGIVGSEIDLVERVLTDGTALRDVDGGNVSRIRSDAGHAVEQSDLDAIKEVIATDGTALSETDVRRVDRIRADGTAALGSDIGRLGEVEASAGALYDTDVDLVEGDITAGEDAIHINEWQRTQVAVDRVYGDIEAAGTALHGADFSYVVADSIDAERLVDETRNAFIAAGEIDVEEVGDDVFAITPDPDDAFATYTGDDWDRFQERLREDHAEVEALRYIAPDIESVESFEALTALEDDLRETAGGMGLEDIRDDHSTYAPFIGNLDGEPLAELLGAFEDTLEEVKRTKVRRFGRNLEYLDGSVMQQLIDRFDTGGSDHSPGRDLFRVGKGSEYDQFIDERAEAVIGLLDEQGDLPSVDGMLEDSPYEQTLKSLYFDARDQLRTVTGLADELGRDVSFDIESRLKKWEGERRNTGRERDIDYNALMDDFVDELDSKIRAYTIEAIEQLGRRELEQAYEDAVGTAPETIEDEDIHVLRAYEEHTRNQEAARKLLRHGDDAYTELDRNQQWLESLEQVTGIDKDQLTEFETTVDTSDIGIREFNQKQGRKLGQLQHHLRQINEALGTEYSADGFEEFQQIRDEIADDIEDGDVPQQAENAYAALEGWESEYEGLLGRQEAVPDELTVRVADPRESIRMGDYFSNSCLAVEKVNGWSAATNAVDANKQILYAEDEDGEVVGRVMTGVTDQYDLAAFSIYNNSEAPIESAVEQAVEEYADHLGLPEVGHDKNIAVLEGEDWYSSAL